MTYLLLALAGPPALAKAPKVDDSSAPAAVQPIQPTGLPAFDDVFDQVAIIQGRLSACSEALQRAQLAVSLSEKQASLSELNKALVDLGAIPKDAVALVEKAKGLPAQLKPATLTSAGLKVTDLPRVVKATTKNVAATVAIPKQAADSAAQVKDTLQGLSAPAGAPALAAAPAIVAPPTSAPPASQPTSIKAALDAAQAFYEDAEVEQAKAALDRLASSISEASASQRFRHATLSGLVAYTLGDNDLDPWARAMVAAEPDHGVESGWPPALAEAYRRASPPPASPPPEPPPALVTAPTTGPVPLVLPTEPEDIDRKGGRWWVLGSGGVVAAGGAAVLASAAAREAEFKADLFDDPTYGVCDQGSLCYEDARYNAMVDEAQGIRATYLGGYGLIGGAVSLVGVSWVFTSTVNDTTVVGFRGRF